MDKEIKITKKAPRRGDDGYKIVSVRMKEEMLERLDRLAAQTNRSRNELINLLLDSAMEIVKVEAPAGARLWRFLFDSVFTAGCGCPPHRASRSG